MSIIFVLIPLAVIIVAIAIGVFFWAVKSNQFDDLERQGYSILFDDDLKKENQSSDSETDSSSESEEIDSVPSSNKTNNE
ncbi:cbb3-type cytochrome oxidase assembly protein CcoS [Glaciecola sp. XM2]|jgi:cbb3-type cytochrome oxidase maturation protein|uniref:cbb3-type cytochrome oxidase assembly protein CcoS n=1 Tax=Glaciecola sp. XM2 TaxID=1914931 RepID=UPI001BDEAA5F|nr:cbb3-type cytochrome oxidase assembly protein CcoS [Glaciecola sp. XM2]MBT1449637.1 cbb3-type cytochrome oxidase assembly protein CcoS [Glaciecola sp. XM2]